MAKVALLLPYALAGPDGLRIYLQLHSRGDKWRLFGGHVERGEAPLQAVVREAKEELRLDLDPRTLGEGWTFPQLLCRLRIPFAGVFLFPVETHLKTLPDGLKPGEGAEGRWWPVRQLPRTLSTADRLLIKAWVVRRLALNQPYIISRLRCPIVTVDLEELHHYAGRNGTSAWRSAEYRLSETIQGLLEQLDRVGARATFFSVATTARKHADLIRTIARHHEVASHGTRHQLACSQTLAQFREDVRTSKTVIEDIAGQPVSGYRAPGWSWPRAASQCACFYTELARAGYKYDSSVIPAAIIGAPGGPSLPYRAEAGIWEFPLPCCGIPLLTKNLDRFAKDGTYRRPRDTRRGGICAPYSGGMFLRCLGTSFSNLVLSYHLKKRGHAMIYMHPRELSGEDASWVKHLDSRYLNLFERWRMGFRTRCMKAGLFSLLARYCGCSIAEFLNDLQIARTPK